MIRRSLLTALALTLGTAAAQTETPTTPTPDTTTEAVEPTGLDHLLRLAGTDIVFVYEFEGAAYEFTLNAEGELVPVNAEYTGEIPELSDVTVVIVAGVPYALAGSLTEAGMPKVTVTLANGGTQTIAMPAALNRVANGLNRTRTAPEPKAEKPVIEPELPTQATERRAGNTDRTPAARGRGK